MTDAPQRWLPGVLHGIQDTRRWACSRIARACSWNAFRVRRLFGVGEFHSWAGEFQRRGLRDRLEAGSGAGLGSRVPHGITFGFDLRFAPGAAQGSLRFHCGSPLQRRRFALQMRIPGFKHRRVLHLEVPLEVLEADLGSEGIHQEALDMALHTGRQPGNPALGDPLDEPGFQAVDLGGLGGGQPPMGISR